MRDIAMGSINIHRSKDKNILIKNTFVFVLLIIFISSCGPLMNNGNRNTKSKKSSSSGLLSVLNYRPDGQLYPISSTMCICENGVRRSPNLSCDQFCSLNNDPPRVVPTLFVEFNLGQDILNNSLFVTPGHSQGTLRGFCHNNIGDGTNGNHCEVQVLNAVGQILPSLTPDISTTRNLITADVSGLSDNSTYYLKLTETQTGAGSEEFSLIKTNVNGTIGPELTLATMGVDHYTCKKNIFDLEGDNTFEGSFDSYFYLANNFQIPILTSGVEIIEDAEGISRPNIHCHHLSYGLIDSSSYPRIDYSPHAFKLWRVSSTLFSDSNNNGEMDIHDYIVDTLNNSPYNQNLASINVFQMIRWASGPQGLVAGETGSTSSQSTLPALGYFMLPWPLPGSNIGETFCPTNSDFNFYQNSQSGQAVTDLYEKLHVIKGALGSNPNTVALYIAELIPHSIQLTSSGTSVSAPQTYRIVNKDYLLSYGYYKAGDGTNIKANEADLSNRPIYFYYPAPSMANPTATDILQNTDGSRKEFIVRSLSDISSTSQVNESADKKFACVPR